jgi:hypothetical protein
VTIWRIHFEPAPSPPLSVNWPSHSRQLKRIVTAVALSIVPTLQALVGAIPPSPPPNLTAEAPVASASRQRQQLRPCSSRPEVWGSRPARFGAPSAVALRMPWVIFQSSETPLAVASRVQQNRPRLCGPGILGQVRSGP